MIRSGEYVQKNVPCDAAVECAKSIANYCTTRFPTDTPPHPIVDVPWFAEKVQACIDEAAATVLVLQRRLERAILLTDTGSDEFKKAFPPKSAGDSYFPRGAVTGWRVVEKIREVLLDG